MFTKAALVLLSCMSLNACDDTASADAEKDESSRSKKKKKKKDRDEETAEDTPSPTATTVSPAPNAPEDPDAVVKTFWKQQIDACNAYSEKVGNTTPPDKFLPGDANDPSRSITVQKRMGPNVFLIEDAGGNRLLADVGNGKFTGPGGATGAMPRPYSFCDPKVWLGTLDEGEVPEPDTAPAPTPAPVPFPAPATDGLAADGLPVIIPAPGSPVPKPQDFDAQPREVTVRRSSTLKCKTNMVREWLQVRCFSNDLGSPHAIQMTSLQGVQAYKFEAPGEKITLVIQVVAGKSPRVTFKWNNGRGFTQDVALVLSWPYGAPRPSLYFEG